MGHREAEARLAYSVTWAKYLVQTDAGSKGRQQTPTLKALLGKYTGDVRFFRRRVKLEEDSCTQNFTATVLAGSASR